MAAKNYTEATIDYMEAYNRYVNMLDEYFPASEIIRGEEIEKGEALTKELINELDRLGKDAEEKRKVWMYFLRVKK